MSACLILIFSDVTLYCCVVSCFWAVMFPLDLAIRRRRMAMRINIICIYGYIYSV